MKPVVSLSDLRLEHWTQGTLYESSDTSFGMLMGLVRLGISYGEVPPGKSACPFHSHHVEDELFVVLEGEGTYRFGSESHGFKAGDVLGAPAGGPKTAHQIINTGSVPLRYLGVGANSPYEVYEYPDSGKFLVSSLGGVAQAMVEGRSAASLHKLRFTGRIENSVDYWDGEPGA